MNWRPPSPSTLTLLELLQRTGVGPVKVRRAALAATVNTPEAVLESFTALWPDHPSEAGGSASAEAVQAEQIVEECRRYGIHIISILDSAYPADLRSLTDAPPLLYIRGDVGVLSSDGVAIVGTREASPQGLKIAQHLARAAAGRRFVVVSGLARGIDSAAHRGALEAGGKTVAVLAHGLDTVAPASNRQLADEIEASGGALVAEHAPGVPPRPPEFVRRNRIQSGLSRASVIVESGREGGAIHQARFTHEQGRLLCTVLPSSEVARAGLRMEGAQFLVETYGARPVTSSSDFESVLASLISSTRTPDLPSPQSRGEQLELPW